MMPALEGTYADIVADPLVQKYQVAIMRKLISPSSFTYVLDNAKLDFLLEQGRKQPAWPDSVRTFVSHLRRQGVQMGTLRGPGGAGHGRKHRKQLTADDFNIILPADKRESARFGSSHSSYSPLFGVYTYQARANIRLHEDRALNTALVDDACTLIIPTSVGLDGYAVASCVEYDAVFDTFVGSLNPDDPQCIRDLEEGRRFCLAAANRHLVKDCGVIMCNSLDRTVVTSIGTQATSTITNSASSVRASIDKAVRACMECSACLSKPVERLGVLQEFTCSRDWCNTCKLAAAKYWDLFRWAGKDQDIASRQDLQPPTACNVCVSMGVRHALTHLRPCKCCVDAGQRCVSVVPVSVSMDNSSTQATARRDYHRRQDHDVDPHLLHLVVLPDETHTFKSLMRCPWNYYVWIDGTLTNFRQTLAVLWRLPDQHALLAKSGLSARTVTGRDSQAVVALRQISASCQVLEKVRFLCHTPLPEQERAPTEENNPKLLANIVDVAFVTTQRVVVVTSTSILETKVMSSPMKLVQTGTGTDFVAAASCRGRCFVLSKTGLLLPNLGTASCVGALKISELVAAMRYHGVLNPDRVLKAGKQYLLYNKLNPLQHGENGGATLRLLPEMLNGEDIDRQLRIAGVEHSGGSLASKREALQQPKRRRGQNSVVW